MSKVQEQRVSADRFAELGHGFMASKVFLTAVSLGVFTELAKGPLDAEALMARLKLHPRAARDFLDTLVALKVLTRDADRYANTPAADAFLDRAKPEYIGGWFEMLDRRLFRFWASLEEGLRTGRPQNEIKTGEDAFAAIYADPALLGTFLHAMSGKVSTYGEPMAAKFPWKDYSTVIDIGAAEGALISYLALKHPHLTGGGFDLPVVGPFFDRHVASLGLSERLRFYPGDFFKDPMPKADVLTMGLILHDWGMTEKRALLAKAYEALPGGGALIVHEFLIDDERKEHVLGLTMSLNMLIETHDGFDFSARDCAGWMREAGFREMRVEPLGTYMSMVVGIK